MSQEFRVAGTLNEFISDLEVLKEQDHSLVVWQNNANDEKEVFEGQYQTYDQDKDKTIISIKLDRNHTFEKDNPVYILEKEKGILFKGRYEFYINSILRVLADDKVFLKEKRNFERFYFNYSKVQTSLKLKIADDKDIELIVSLRDVSEGGYAFRFNRSKSKIFLDSKSVELFKIGGIDLPKSLIGAFVHRSKLKKTNALDSSDDILIGVKFEKPSKLISKVMQTMAELES